MSKSIEICDALDLVARRRQQLNIELDDWKEGKNSDVADAIEDLVESLIDLREIRRAP